MVPYRGRLALRIARLVLALGCVAWYVLVRGPHLTWVIALLAAYTAYAIGALLEVRFDSTVRAGVALVTDTIFFGFWAWAGLAGLTPAGFLSALVCGYVFASAVVLHDFERVLAVAVTATVFALVVTPPGQDTLLWTVIGTGAVATALSLYKRYLERRMSNTLRHNVIIRSQAQSAREAERQRIAADFHDGPLQSFISFQMRLEIVKKLLARDIEAAADELRQLQDLCRTQVSELRSFVRSMRPAEEGMSLAASLNRMVDQFQRETGISATFSSSDFQDPADTEVSLELLQIVREALNNVQKHSGATRIALSLGKSDQKLEISAEDNGGGYPFSGTFTLEELELLRLGPVSIKRRVRMLGGEMMLESRPGQGSSLQIRIPV